MHLHSHKGKSFRPAPPQGGRPTIDKMAFLLKKSGITLSSHQLEQLWTYHNFLRQRNNDRDLTRIINFEAMVVKHYVDCMIVGHFVKIPSPVVDVGTGAGFPGIPLKIRYPNLEITLAEPRPNRVQFLKDSIQKLGLKNATVFDHKVVSRSFQKPMKAVVTRALETIDKTILRTSACLGEGGKLILLKGPGVDPELQDVKRRFGDKFRLELDKSYCLPGTDHERRLIVLQKLVPAELPDQEEPCDTRDGVPLA